MLHAEKSLIAFVAAALFKTEQQHDARQFFAECIEFAARYRADRNFPVELAVTLPGQIFIEKLAGAGFQLPVEAVQQPAPDRQVRDQHAKGRREGEQQRVAQRDPEFNGVENPLPAQGHSQTPAPYGAVFL